MMLGYIFLTLLLLSFVFFILDGIVGPSEQVLIRFSLHKTAQEVDEIAATGGVDKSVVRRLRSMSHNLINNMARFNLTTLASIKYQMEKDPKFREESEQRVAELKQCENEDVLDVLAHIVRVGDRVLFWNSVGWMVFIIPIALCVGLFGRFQAGVKLLLTTPQKSLDKYDISLTC
ncbi:hypothetical protein FSY59_00570 [Comamonas sp. Z3]|uniref:hypothetical protein n=1 Tax=Comamonas sp. Z3 TaxID=2601247 RepID=UPI0011E79A87|nr:hypothetical protein [Comamonas sp. Z3]TYK73185.1 hypothetical protein FSY59_00570 [Comamonas sp. Z3]